MKKLSRKSLVAIALVVAIGASLAIGGTLAYFTDETQEVKNTFTMGNVSISLDEGKYDPETGETDTNDRVTDGNDYGVLMPGTTITKDPTVHVDGNSQESYLFVKFDVTKYASMIMMYAALNNTTVNPADLATNKDLRESIVDTYIGGLVHADWAVMNPEALQEAIAYYGEYKSWPEHIQIILGHYDTVAANEDIEVFNQLIIPENITSDMLEAVPNFTSGQFQINVTAYAIQADGLATLDEAYDAMFPAAETTTP